MCPYISLQRCHNICVMFFFSMTNVTRLSLKKIYLPLASGNVRQMVSSRHEPKERVYKCHVIQHVPQEKPNNAKPKNFWQIFRWWTPRRFIPENKSRQCVILYSLSLFWAPKCALSLDLRAYARSEDPIRELDIKIIDKFRSGSCSRYNQDPSVFWMCTRQPLTWLIGKKKALQIETNRMKVFAHVYASRSLHFHKRDSDRVKSGTRERRKASGTLGISIALLESRLWDRESVQEHHSFRSFHIHDSLWSPDTIAHQSIPSVPLSMELYRLLRDTWHLPDFKETRYQPQEKRQTKYPLTLQAAPFENLEHRIAKINRKNSPCLTPSTSHSLVAVLITVKKKKTCYIWHYRGHWFRLIFDIRARLFLILRM